MFPQKTFSNPCHLLIVHKIFTLLLSFVVILSMFNIDVKAKEKANSNNELTIVYFYSAKCLSCRENQTYIERLSKISGVNLIKYDTDSEDCKIAQIAYAKHYGVADEDALSVPAIYFGDKYYKLAPSNHNLVTTDIDNYISGREPFVNFEYNGSEDNSNFFEKIAEKMSIAGVLLAGLFDGINPCAISMLAVFYSFLLCTGNKKKTILMSMFFIIGIFMANFLFGLGIKTFYDIFAGNNIVIAILYSVSIAVCFAAIILNTIDILNRNKSEAKNQLPDKIKFKLSSIMRSSVFSKFVVPVALVVGFIIGAVELACTGQIYLPTLTYMITTGSNTLTTILLLLAYNIMFVLPLIIITIVIGVVKQPESVKSAVMKKNFILKILANIFFVFMIFVLVREITLIF